MNALVALIVAAAISVLAAVRRRRRKSLPARAVIVSPPQSTVVSRDGAVHSVQSAELTMSRLDMERLWNPTNLENLARTYWRFLSRVTLGLIRVVYGQNERSVVLLFKPLTLLRFEAPDYELSPEHGSVRWLIRDGLLVARAGRGCGFLALNLHRGPAGGGDEPADWGDGGARGGDGGARGGDGGAGGGAGPGGGDSEGGDARVMIHIDVEVANFYPSIVASMSVPVYEATQNTIHILVTHAFLRSLARLHLARSKVGRFAGAPPDSLAGSMASPETERTAQP